ncbi:hypothetical protein I8748_09100 [Nostoc sp. CENA67]|uniref:Uncharacterized protein n=1 Tax=Amazonocrinis nigriterrae CENA67 TaxID=2794033 RepID=A0A8J7HTQ9_9NOST|nr:hypothetical protein [Amazonocrinis nigriterrae]MBH8562329.1 hypothetical protein [Amazonocrinis nigriterrae CENA67]
MRLIQNRLTVKPLEVTLIVLIGSLMEKIADASSDARNVTSKGVVPMLPE